MAVDPSAIQSFVPAQLIEWLTESGLSAAGPNEEQEHLVTWFADLSNFSLLTHLITERERAGPEVVGELLNQTFGSIIETVAGYGGSVFEFAGDSVLATWSIRGDQQESQTLAMAARCGIDVLGLKLPDVYEELPPLDLRVGIGMGRAVFMELGGVNGRWQFAAGGPAFDQIGLASAAARPGEVVLSPEAARFSDARFTGHSDQQGFLRLSNVADTEPTGTANEPEMTSELAGELRRFLSPQVLRRIEAGQSEWLAEFRQVTSLFVNLPGLDLGSGAAREALQDVVAETQRSLERFEGTLTRILDDDKGVTLVSSFGLPPFAHEEDPYLAVQTAEEIQRTMQQMRLDYGIGIATGRAFCGAYGSPIRRDYTTIGREVNLAARLMQAARFEILCDEATAKGARRIEFHPMGQRTVRGWDKPVRVFKPLWEKSGVSTESEQPIALVGRESEQNQLTAWLGALVRAHSSAVVVVEGDAGIGKTALATDLIRRARSFEIEVLIGDALPVAQAPYQAWKDVISRVLGIDEIRSVERRQEVVRDRLARWPQFAEWEALLNSVLDLQFPENATTRGMSGDNRRESTVELLVAVLSEAAEGSPLLIVLDDLHWFDSASWAVASAVARKVSPLLLVLLTRPLIEQAEMLDDLTASGTAARLVLSPLDRRDALRLARDTLQVEEMGAEVADLIVEAAEGVPFFIEELALSLREGDALEVDGGVARLARPSEELGVPHTLSSVVLSRIDRLDPELALTLKVASVIGRSFDTRALEASHPSHPGVEELSNELEKLKSLELIVETSPGAYDFKHALTRDTAYDLLLFDQRRRIHRSIALFLESRNEQNQEGLYGLLAYHWDRGDEQQKALTYYERTGASSLRKGANREAIEAHTRSLDLVSHHPEEFQAVGRLRTSQWHLEIGQAHEALGSFDEAERSLHRALDLLGVRLASEPLSRLIRLMWELAKQIVHIVAPFSKRVPAHDEEKARLGQASRIGALIGEIYFFKRDLFGYPLVNLMAINLGEKSGEPLVAGLAYSNLGYLAGTLRLRRLASRYFRMARAAEEAETDIHIVDAPFVLVSDEMGPGHLIAVALAESVLALTFDEWERAQGIVTEGLRRCERLGDKYSAGIALAVRGFVSYCSGEIEDARLDYNQLLASARQRANREHEGWATSFSIPVLLAQGRIEEARAMAASAMSILDDVDSLTVPVIHATRSQVQLHSGHLREARASAELALQGIDSSPIFIYLAGFASMMDTLLELIELEENPSSISARELDRSAREGLKKLRGFARILPFARPKYWLLRGRLERREGRNARAARSLRKGLARAERSGFTWDEGLLHLELAAALPDAHADRLDHLREARRLFELVGSTRDLARVAALEG